MKKVIYLQKIGEVNQSILKKLKKNLKLTFNKYIDSVEILEKQISLSSLPYNQKRKQYDVSSYLECLKRFLKNKNQFRTLAIIDNDIYANGYNYIFGRAYFPSNEFLRNNGVAIISIFRLREGFYRRAEKKKLFKFRIMKEAIHEIGHTFDLKHCKNYCVMQKSKSLDEAEKKPAKFCLSCSKKLKNLLANLN